MAFNVYDTLSKYAAGFLPQYKNPSDSAMPYLNQISGVGQQYYNPYINSGNQSMSLFAPQVESMSTPQGATQNYNQLGAGYEQSPGTQNAINNAAETTNQYAAAGGMAGSPTEQTAIANQTVQLSDEDFNNYMKTVGGYQSQGLQGEGDLMHQGFEASSQLAQMLSKALSEQAAYAYSGTRNQNKQNTAESGTLDSLVGDATDVAMSIF